MRSPFALVALPIAAAVASAVAFVACGGANGGGDIAPATDSGSAETAPDTTAPIDTGAVAETAIDTGATDAFDAADADGGDGGPAPWPTCDSKPAGTLSSTIAEIWTASSSKPVFDWVSGAVVTAI